MPPRMAARCRSPTSARSRSARLSWPAGGVVAARGRDPDFVMCVTNPVGEQLAELQLTLGEGPCHDVLASAAPVLAADLSDAESAPPVARVHAGGTSARRRGRVRVPADVGAIRAGVLGLYRGSPGPLPGRQLGDLLILADAATVMLLGSAHGGTQTEDGDWLDGQAPGPGTAPRRGRPGHRHADGPARRHGRGGVRPAAGVRLCSGPAPGRRGRRHRCAPAAAAPRPGSRPGPGGGP